MRIEPHSFNSYSLQQLGKLRSTFSTIYDWNLGGISVGSSERNGRWPVQTGKGYSDTIKLIKCYMPGLGDERDNLVSALDVEGSEAHQLIMTDEYGRKWYVMATCTGVNLEGVDDVVLGVSFTVQDPVWRRVKKGTASISFLYGTGTTTITPLGNQQAFPKITVTPAVAGGAGFAFKRFVKVINTGKALVNQPLDIADGLDTSDLVSNFKCQSAGQDFRVYNKGKEIYRWFDGFNTASTKIVINANMVAGTPLTLGHNIAASGAIASITFANNATNIANIARMQAPGLYSCGNEIFAYTGLNKTKRQITGITRQARQSTMEAHSTGDTGYYMDNDLWFYYGDPTLDAPVQDDTRMPMMDLAASSNSLNVYDEFADADKTRSGIWSGSVLSSANKNIDITNLSDLYTATQNTEADPVTAMGMAERNFRKKGVWQTENAIIAWSIYHPMGVTAITATGNKWRYGTSWPTAGLQKSRDGKTWYNVWVDATPGSASSWEALAAHSAVSLGGTFNYLRFVVSGLITGASARAYYEITGVELTIASANIPQIDLMPEIAMYAMDLTITNGATGDSLSVKQGMFIGDYIVIDTEKRTVEMDDGTNILGSLQPFDSRKDWLPLLGGVANVLTLTDSGSGDVDIEWEDRYL